MGAKQLGFSDYELTTAKKQTKQVQHLTQKQWDQLLAAMVDLSLDTARQLLDTDEYMELKWSKGNRLNQRSWVDLYDALLLDWFFYLRAEDMYRIKSEWFRNQGTRLLSAIWRQQKRIVRFIRRPTTEKMDSDFGNNCTEGNHLGIWFFLRSIDQKVIRQTVMS